MMTRRLPLTCGLMEAKSGPVVVGGVGGSGTRLIAEILQRVGIYLGRDLNSAKDNLWFTLLFRRPRWFERALVSGDPSEVMRSLSWFEDAMLGRLRADEDVFQALDDAVEELVSQGLDREFVEGRRRHFIDWGTSAPDVHSWGWKEPNSHIYLEFLAQHFGDRISYVHVIRDGIELVRRGNYWQLSNWGGHFGLPVDSRNLPSDPLVLRSMFLDYWIAANRRVLQLGPQLFGPRFLLVNLNRLRETPVPEVNRLLELLGEEPSPDLVASLSALAVPLVNPPAPSDYYELSDQQERGFVELGFDIPMP